GLIQRLDLKRALGTVGAVCLLPALFMAFTSREGFALPEQLTSLAAVLQSPFLWLTSLVLLLYRPLETVLTTWATTYITDLGVGERRAVWLLSGFWFTFLASRLLVALLFHYGILRSGLAEAWLILGLALIVGVLLGNLAGSRTHLSAATGFLVVGLL